MLVQSHMTCGCELATIKQCMLRHGMCIYGNLYSWILQMLSSQSNIMGNIGVCYYVCVVFKDTANQGMHGTYKKIHRVPEARRHMDMIS